MKIPITSMGKAGFSFTGLVFVSAIMGAGFSGAETYRQGDSITTIQQSGGSGQSESQVTRYQDGQRIITQDGSSTDITIQRIDRFPSSDDRGEYPETDLDCFDRRFGEERFSGIAPDAGSALDDFKGRPSRASEDFRQRMLDRMRRDRLP